MNKGYFVHSEDFFTLECIHSLHKLINKNIYGTTESVHNRFSSKVKKIRHKYKTGMWNNIKQREKYYSLTLLQAILKTLKILHEFYKS